MKSKLIFLIVSLMIFNGTVSALTCAIPGKDGIGAISSNVNTYFPPASSGTLTAGTSSLSLGAAIGPAPFAVGDLLLIIQMQDSTGALAGNFEYSQVASVSGGGVNLASGLINSYAQDFTATTLRTYQVIRVPQYSSATITGTVSPPAWTVNTTTGIGVGGVFVIDVAGALTINGTIDASGKGFRGAFGINGSSNRTGGVFNDANYAPLLTNINGALKGEGTRGLPDRLFDGTTTPVSYANGLYPLGTAGQGAIGNAGGGGNDGSPATGGNAYNSGGGGGGNGAAGGAGGNSWSTNNTAGGRGGLQQANAFNKLFLGGGGGAGAINSTSNTNALSGTTATGAIAGSGATGGGIVILRAGRLVYQSGSILANGNDALDNVNNGGLDGAGGGGAGGSVIVQAQAYTGTALPVSANGGAGGDAKTAADSHGPGGGGGGGFFGASTNVVATASLNGGANGVNRAVGATPANAFNATSGGNATANNSFPNPNGTTTATACYPNLSVSKTTSTPTISGAGATTATYTITATNASAGLATGVDIIDNALPPGWSFATTNSVVFSPALSATVLGGFIEAATAGVPAIANSPGTIANFTTNGVPVAAPVWNNLTIGGNGNVAITYTVSIPSTATVGTYHNPAGIKYVDPTRSTAGREITPLTNNLANRLGAQVGGTINTSYETGSLAGTAVTGSNYSGLLAGATGEDVKLLADLSVTKAHSPSTMPVSGSGLSGTYTVVVSNTGRAMSALTYATNQATPATVDQLTGILTVSDTLPTGFTLNAAPALTGVDAANWSCTGAAGASSFTCTRTTGAGDIAAATVLISIAVPVRIAASACPGPQTNTATISQAAIGESNTTNNSAIDSASINCAASVLVEKTDNQTSAISGASNTYVLTVTNNGPAALDGAVLTDAVGAGLNCPASNPVVCAVITGAAACPVAAQTVGNLTGTGISLLTLPANGKLTFTYSCLVN